MFEQSSESKSLHEQRSNRSYKVFASTAATLKYSSFREEQEVRIIAPVMRGEAAREFPSRIPKCIFYRSRNGLPIPYVKLFDIFGNLPITRIIVGPQRYQDKVVYALQLALEGKGLRVEVTKPSIGFLP